MLSSPSSSGLSVWLSVAFMLKLEVSCIKKYFNLNVNTTVEF